LTAVPQTWDVQADVVVVRFGAAGACAALEAAGAGCDVVVLDRFGGGGATALSGGVVYVVPGLYAAGRNAVGLCSRSYVSGLSLADCVFSGRRAGRHAAAAAPIPSAGGRAPGHQ
jgi:succinate dehydrogenase/fumarate reductase flavoprotein subunit